MLGDATNARRIGRSALVGLPHRSSATTDKRNGSPATTSEGSIAFQRAAGPGNNAKPGDTGNLGEFVGGKRINVGLELEALLAVGLQPQTRRALRGDLQSGWSGVAGTQEAAADANKERVAPKDGR